LAMWARRLIASITAASFLARVLTVWVVSLTSAVRSSRDCAQGFVPLGEV
jgi:hypothetical protein